MCGFEGTYLFGPVAQLVRAPPCHGGGRGFESHPGRLHEIVDAAFITSICCIVSMHVTKKGS